VNAKLADELTTLPFSVQLANVNPLLAVAVTVRELPGANAPAPLTVPPAGGDALSVIVLFAGLVVKLATNVRLALRVNVKLADELTTLPFSVQLEKVNPLLAVAVTVREPPDGNVPAPLSAPAAGGDALSEIMLKLPVKFATKLRLALRVNVKLADVLTTLPFSVQLEKVNPLLGLAVTVRELPEAKVPAPLTVPPVLGDAPTEIVKFGLLITAP